MKKTDNRRNGIGVKASVIGLSCNLILFAAKLAVGLWSGAISVVADAMNNLADASGSIVSLAGFRLAAKPADAKHPYGHARYEYVAGMIVAALTLVVGLELAKSSVEKVIHPTTPAFSGPMLIVLAVSVAAKAALSVYNRVLYRKTSSLVLKATSADSRNDALITAAVLAAAWAESVWHVAVDGWVGLAIAVFILVSGVRLVIETIDPLIGTAGSEELRRQLIAFLLKEDRVLGIHDLLIHDYGHGHSYASVHVELDHREDAVSGHDLLDRLERQCLSELNVHLVIHHDPVVAQDPMTERLEECLCRALRCFGDNLSIHDLRVDGHTVCFDVAVPDHLSENTPEIERELQDALRHTPDGSFEAVVVFDPVEWHEES